MRNIEKTKAYYEFNTECPLNGNDVYVTISLVINYSLNTFSILTNKGNNFIFLNGNEDNYVLWLTISDLIKLATEFAVEELSKNKTDK